jgi:ribosomal protein S12 methylthiotransferase accessory factor
MSTIIELEYEGGKKLNARFGDHLVKTDQPPEDGGEDTAPTPSDLFLVSLATCAGLYAYSFCESRKIDTSQLRIRTTCHYDEDQKRYTRISTDMTLPPEFPERYQKALIRAMDACFVKKHLHQPPAFEIEAHY